MQFDLGTRPRTQRRKDDDEPMRLLVLGDFRGAGGSGRTPLATRSTLQVDVDKFDDIMRRLEPRLSMPAGELRFKQIDDFHPDQLFASLESFRTLRDQRAAPPADTGNELGRLLGTVPRPDAPPAPAPESSLDALIRNVVAPHIVKDTAAQTRAHVSAVDAAIAEQMRTLLHDPAFQALEAAWRGVRWLVSSLELDENLQLHLFDVSRDELLADIVAAKGQLAETGLYRALVAPWRNVPGGQRWSALIGLSRFGASDADIGLLAALGLIASQAGVPFIGDADPVLSSGDEARLTGWETLRRSEAAPWIALAAPRVLLRLPYGKRSDPIESFAFEEIVGPPENRELLWGHGSLAVALLIGRGFTAEGWNADRSNGGEIDDLPAWTFERDGEPQMQPGAERFLTENEMRALLTAGLTPIVSRRDRNAAVVVRVQSISDPPGALAW